MNMEPMVDSFERIVPTDDDTYTGEDGRLYCRRCHTPRQSRIILPWSGAERLVNCVCKCMDEEIQKAEEENQRRNRMLQVSGLRAAGFPAEEIEQYTFDRDDGTMPTITRAMRAYVDNFPELSKTGKGLLLYGNVGTGKTFAAGCVVNALEDMGYPCLMTSFSRLTNLLFDLRENKQRYLDKLLLFDLVVIDDLGVERDTEYMGEQVTTILDSFYRAKVPMIITSNYTPKQLVDTSEIQKRRAYDRLLERCHPVLVDGPSRRKDQGRRDFAGMNKLLGL